MRRGIDDDDDSGQISLNIPRQLGGQPFSHEDILTPHWKDFSYALGTYSPPPDFLGKFGTSFEITNIEILREAQEDVLDKATFMWFNKVCFENNAFGISGLQFVLQLTGKNEPKLDEFKMVNNTMFYSPVPDVEGLCQAIANHPSLRKLIFSTCLNIHPSLIHVNDMRAIMSTCSNLISISLSHDYIHADGDTFISEYLETNPSLKYLYLRSSSRLDDDNVVALANALEKNTNLVTLNLRKNKFADRGVKALKEAVFNSFCH